MSSTVSAMRYAVRESFLAVRDDPPRQFTFLAIPTGSAITVKGSPQQSGLVDIEYDGIIAAAFMRDILARCERVEWVA